VKDEIATRLRPQLQGLPSSPAILEQMKRDAILTNLSDAVALGKKDREAPVVTTDPQPLVPDSGYTVKSKLPGQKKYGDSSSTKDAQSIWRNRTDAQDPVVYANEDESPEVLLRQGNPTVASETKDTSTTNSGLHSTASKTGVSQKYG